MNPDVTTTADLDQALRAEPLPVLQKNRGEPVFRDSWEAEAFAIGNILVKDDQLSCKQWMDLMAAAIQTAPACVCRARIGVWRSGVKPRPARWEIDTG